MKKRIALVLTLCLCLGLAVFPIAAFAEGATTLKILVVRRPHVLDCETNEYVLWLEEQTGIHLEWEQLSEEAAFEKLPLVMAGGDLPDIIMSFYSPVGRDSSYALTDHLLLPLNDLIDEHGVEINRMFEEQPGTKEFITSMDGNIYSLPLYHDNLGYNYLDRARINSTFLEALNMEKPTTTEEFYEYLKAVKEGDPNGNGLADEIPLVGAVGVGCDPFTWLTQPFIFDNGMWADKTDVDENGQIISILDKDAYREALRYMKRLLDEELLYLPSLTQPADSFYRLLGENPDGMIVGTVLSANVDDFVEPGGDRYESYTSLAPLEGPTGLRQTSYNPYFNIMDGAFAVTSDCADPVAAIKLVDFMYSYEASMRCVMGVKDVDWRDALPDETNADGEPAVYAKINNLSGVQNQMLGLSGVYYLTRGMALSDAAFDHEAGIMSPMATADLIYQECMRDYVPYGKELIPNLSIPVEYRTEYGELSGELYNYSRDTRGRFVMGELSLDDDWDSYLEELYAVGLERYLELKQIAYDLSPIKVNN